MTMNGVLAVIVRFSIPNPVALIQLRQNREDIHMLSATRIWTLIFLAVCGDTRTDYRERVH